MDWTQFSISQSSTGDAFRNIIKYIINDKLYSNIVVIYTSSIQIHICTLNVYLCLFFQIQINDKINTSRQINLMVVLFFLILFKNLRRLLTKILINLLRTTYQMFKYTLITCVNKNLKKTVSEREREREGGLQTLGTKTYALLLDAINFKNNNFKGYAKSRMISFTYYMKRCESPLKNCSKSRCSLAVVLIRKRTILGVWVKVTCRLCVIVKIARASKKLFLKPAMCLAIVSLHNTLSA